MRILLTLFCILPLTIDTAFATAQWIAGAAFNTIQNQLDKTCKKTTETEEKTIPGYDKSGGFCLDCGTVRFVGECSTDKGAKVDELEVAIYDGSSNRTDKFCYCKQILPRLSKQWTRYDEKKYETLQQCNTLCEQDCNANSKKYTCNDMNSSENLTNTIKVDCGDSKYIPANYSPYKTFSETSTPNSGFVCTSAPETTETISASRTIEYHYYHSIEDQTGTYHCVNSSIPDSDYAPNGTNKSIICDPPK